MATASARNIVARPDAPAPQIRRASATDTARQAGADDRGITTAAAQTRTATPADATAAPVVTAAQGAMAAAQPGLSQSMSSSATPQTHGASGATRTADAAQPGTTQTAAPAQAKSQPDGAAANLASTSGGQADWLGQVQATLPALDGMTLAAAAPASQAAAPSGATPLAQPPSPQLPQAPQPPQVQLAQAAASVQLGTDGAGHVTIRLAPAELGQVEIRIAHAPSGASVQVAAERPETLAALRTDLGHLHQALDRAGVATTRTVSFELAPSSDHPATQAQGMGGGFAQQQDGAQQQARQDRQPPQPYANTPPAADPIAEFAPLRHASLPDETGLNITA